MTNTHSQIIRLSNLPKYLGISQTTIWRAMKRGDFPQPIILGPRARGYRISTLDAWLDQQQSAEGGIK